MPDGFCNWLFGHLLSETVLYGAHLTLDTEVIEDTADITVGTDVIFSFHREPPFLLSPLHFPVIDRHLIVITQDLPT